ncbi:probable RNA methyltransferase Y17G7B.18 [Centruroides vittatus]|uniref:probable RNA methyltransferase Y17G7B.18 n=1 Tax=Centruroides vittatus TaxID=120091 RepID=UPI00350F1CFF
MASSTSLETIVQVNESAQRYLCQSMNFATDDRQNYDKMRMAKMSRKTSVPAKKNLPKQESTNHGHQHKWLTGKRRHTFSGEKFPPKKRYRGNTIVPPTKFLLGGNINDPLNLESLADEEVNKRVNQVTPYSSPIPTPKYRTQVEVLIPTNINDPLNLNTGEDIEFNLVSPKSKKNRRNRSRKKEATEVVEDKVEDVPVAEEKEKEVELPIKTTTEDLKNLHIPTSKSEERVVDKIVSPVVPQGSPSKFPRRYHRSISRENVEGVKTATTKSQRKRHKQRKKQPDQVKYREKDEQFRYGNYNRYYGYRNQHGEDPRLKCMKKKWFEGKDVLDIGCNVGHFTLEIAKNLGPKKIIGLDIDPALIKVARKNVRHYISTQMLGNEVFPVSMAVCYGPVARTTLPFGSKQPVSFPNNIFFVQGNYVLESDEFLEMQRPEFDTILCLSLTKWIHLNWGDEGVKRVFRRMYAQLRPGGRMILEAQPWPSYVRKKKLTETTFKNYLSIQMRPEQFNEYLLSKEVGFSTCELIDAPAHPSKGFCRPIYLFTKGVTSPREESIESQEGKSANSKKETVDK